MPTRVDRARDCGWVAVLATLTLAGTAHAAATLTRTVKMKSPPR
jgi:hypothetical protein